MGENRDLVKCPHCGMEAPAEGLLCIYCGNSLNLRTGFHKGVWFFLVACALLISFILWVL